MTLGYNVPTAEAESGSRGSSDRGSDLPLAGIRVLAIEQAVAAPLATRHLADLGARVIKVERPDGGDFTRSYDQTVAGTSAFFVWCNRGKESIVLDLKDPHDAGRVRRLVSEVDVVVHNLAPGAMERLGFGDDVLLDLNPRVISCAVVGFAGAGADAGRKAYDLVIQAEAGLFDVTGDGALRVRAGISVADIAGGMHAVAAILAALVRRATTGVGSSLTISMLDALVDWMSVPLLQESHGVGFARLGTRHPSIAPYGIFSTGDGDVLIAAQNEREWTWLCGALGRPELRLDARFATNAARVQHHAELRAEIDASLADRTADEAIDCLDRAGIAACRVRSLDEVLSHPHLATNARWEHVDVGGDAVRVPRSPFDVGPPRTDQAVVPALGANTDDVLGEFGLS